jgi:uncharacterized membrane protein YfhO
MWQFLLKNPSSKLLDLLGVKYIVWEPNTADLQVPDKFQFVEEKGVRLYRNAGALPRAFIVHHAVVENDFESVLRHLSSDTFDPQKYIVIDRSSSKLIRSTFSSMNQNSLTSSRAKISRFTANEITVDVRTNTEAYLVLSEIIYPGWNVYVDGQRRDMIRANGIFRAVQLQNGSRSVVFKYEPLSLRIGAVISCMTLAIALASLAIIRRRLRTVQTESVKTVPAN